jgi:hypothetical protein
LHYENWGLQALDEEQELREVGFSEETSRPSESTVSLDFQYRVHSRGAG